METPYTRQQRHIGIAAEGHTLQAGSGRPVAPLDAARANDVFDHFLNANTLKSILGHYRLICDLVHLRPSTLPNFYPKLKQHLTSWRAKAVWKKFDARANNKVYGKGRISPDTRVLIIGAGPCGLRTAIEAQMLGAKVVVLEKRDRMSRNNVLHLWPFVIDDLRSLGAKKFFGKFCAGSIDHISIRQLQCMVLKVALLLGVEIHTEVSYESLVEPSAENKRGWRASVKPHDHPVSQYEFDVIIGADGKRNTLQGFKRKEFRGKLAIAITANFINRRTEAEARVEEISGVAFIFNQKFFKDLYAETQIDLENIVYYKDDTHYFVMTAKKHSLLSKSVIRSDQSDTARLLSPDNVDRDALMAYAREAAEFSTGRQMLDLEFAVNHYGQPDVAMFDFTSMYAAENASRVVQRDGYKLLCVLVGDSLLEPFWPTGSGCARGFLSSLDAAWAIRAWGSGTPPLSVLAERESIYRLLGGTTPENIHRDSKAYSLDPSSRYPKLNRQVLTSHQVAGLYDTDDVEGLKAQTRDEIEVQGIDIIEETVTKRRKIDEDDLLSWIKKQIIDYNLDISDLSQKTFKDGKILCAILHHYRPDLVDFKDLPEDDVLCCHIAFELLEKEIGIPSIILPNEMATMECSRQQLVPYLSQIYEKFKREIAHINHPKMIVSPPKTEKCCLVFPIKVPSKENSSRSYNVPRIKKPLNKNQCLKTNSCQKDSTRKLKVNVGDGSIRKMEKKLKTKSFSENFHKSSSLALDKLNFNGNKNIQQYDRKLKNSKSLLEIGETIYNNSTSDLVVEKGIQNDEHFKEKLLFPCPNIVIKNETTTETNYIKVWSVSDYLLIVPRSLPPVVKFFSDTKTNGTKLDNIATMDNVENNESSNCLDEIELKTVKAHCDILLQHGSRSTSANFDGMFAKQFLESYKLTDPDCNLISCKLQENVSYNSKNLTCPCEFLKLATKQQNSSQNKYCMRIKIKNNGVTSTTNPENHRKNKTRTNCRDSICLDSILLKKYKEISDIQTTDKQLSSTTINFMTVSNNQNSTRTLSNAASANYRFQYSNGVVQTRRNHPTSTFGRSSSGKVVSKILKYGAGKYNSMQNTLTSGKGQQNRRIRPLNKRHSPPPSTVSDRIRTWLRTNDFEDHPNTVIGMKGLNKGRVEDEMRHVEELLGQQRQNLGGDNCTDITGLTSVTRSPPLWGRIVVDRDRAAGRGEGVEKRAESVVRFGANGKPVLAQKQVAGSALNSSEKEHHQRKTGSNVTSHSNNSAKNSNKNLSNNEKLSPNPKHYHSPIKNNTSKTDLIPNTLNPSETDNNNLHSISTPKVDMDRNQNHEKVEKILVSNDKLHIQTSTCKQQERNNDINNAINRVVDNKVELDEDSYNSMEELTAVLMDRFRGVSNGMSSALAEHNNTKVRIIRTVSNPFSAITERDDDEVTPSEMPELKPHTLNALSGANATVANPPMHHRNFAGARVPSGIQGHQTKHLQYVKQAVPLSAATPSVDGASRSGRKRKSSTAGGAVTGAAGGGAGTTGLDRSQNHSQLKNERDEDFIARIRHIEDKWYDVTAQDPNTDRHNIAGVAKKPKDLMRAIGKIETSDWNIREIEKKIRENRSSGGGKGGKERVPKWSREQFQARQAKMERKHLLDRQDSTNGKYSELDKNLKLLDQRLKEGTVRELNQHNKVAKITEQLRPKHQAEKRQEKASDGIKMSPSFVLPSANISESCHFCSKRVYLMEKLSVENRCFHKNCFRCEYCHTLLRPGAYKYDAEGKYGQRFYCIHHYGFSGQIPLMVSTRNRTQSQKNDVLIPTNNVGLNVEASTPVKKAFFSEDMSKGDITPLSSNKEGSLSLLGRVTGVDLLDRVQTPERIEFSNLSTGNAASDHEEPPSIMDEDEWTDRNFGASTAEVGSSDEDDSYSDSDSEEEYEEAIEEPATKEGTMRILEQYSRFSRKHDSDSEEYSSSEQSSYCENTSGDEESDTATEGEEEIRARELRKQEVRLEPPIITDTGTDTEINSDDTAYSKSNEAPNSATEISTDSEFAQDEPTPTREIPSIVFNDAFVTKTRGSSNITKVQVTACELLKHNAPLPGKKISIEPKKTEIKPIVPNDILQTVAIKKPTNLPLLNRLADGFPLNRTQSTSGIAAIRSLELKKRYLLGEAIQTSTNSSGIQKSGSASTLDSKLKSFHSNITDCQKMLKPTQEVLFNESTKTVFGTQIVKAPLLGGASVISNISHGQMNKSGDNLTDINKKDKNTTLLEKNNADNQESAIFPTTTTPVLVKQTQFQSPCVHTETPPPNEIIQPEIMQLSEKFENELEGRPRSPVHETSIIVPEIDWTSKTVHEDAYSDSMSSITENDDIKIQEHPSQQPLKLIETVVSKNPIENCKLADLEPLDSLNYIPSISDIASKSISSEKKSLNQPKTLPGLYNNSEQSCIQSGRSTPTHGANDSCITGFLTETELSDWARDSAVSDDFDYEYEHVVPTSRRHKEPKKLSNFVDASNKDVNITSLNLLDLDNSQHVCGKTDEVLECVNSILNPNLKNIEYMDTGSENSSCSDDNIKRNNGYVQFYNENDMAEDSLSPVINNLSKITVVEVKNPLMTAVIDDMTDFDELSTPTKNTGFCEVDVTPVLASQTKFGGKVVDLNPTDLEELKQKQTLIENEMDSLQVIDTGTEDNTCSDSTVKNVEEFKPFLDNNNVNLDKKRLEDKLMQVKQDMLNKKDSELFVEHCQRLQGKISEFTNVRDSIDVRKNSQKNQQQTAKPDLIQQPEIRLNLTPNNFYQKEIIAKERDLNQRLIHEMILNKYKIENKSFERKKRSRNNSFSPKTFELSKSATTVDLGPQTVLNTPENVTPDVILSTTQQNPLHKSQTMSEISNFPPKSTLTDCYPTKAPRASQIPKVYTCYQLEKTPSYEKIRQEARAKAKLLSDKELGLSPEDKILRLRERIRGLDTSGSVKTQPNKSTDLNRANSNVIIRDTKSGMLPSVNRNSIAESQFNRINIYSTHNNIYSNDTLNSKKRPKSFRCSSVEKQPELTTSKSVQNIGQQHLNFPASSTNDQHQSTKSFKSDSNLLMDNSLEDLGEIKEGPKKKSKDRERRKSITKVFSDLFVSIRKEGNINLDAAKGFWAKISPKARERSKVKETVSLRKSASSDLHFSTRDASPPPVPPLPDNYIENKLEDSSEAEFEFHRQCIMDNIDPTSPHAMIDSVDTAANGNAAGSRRNSRGTTKRSARQSQLKRHRTAQEIQRKLEETEVKIRELELHGITIEKRLRGEPNSATTTINIKGECCDVDENCEWDDDDWLRRWFGVMRDLTEWRRYERELATRAEELELEDRHARLQIQLRDKLTCDTTENDGNVSGTSAEAGIILEEMMDIVTKRDTIIANLEQDKQRYTEEDKQFDEEMLTKGLKLLPSHWKSIDSN